MLRNPRIDRKTRQALRTHRVMPHTPQLRRLPRRRMLREAVSASTMSRDLPKRDPTRETRHACGWATLTRWAGLSEPRSRPGGAYHKAGLNCGTYHVWYIYTCSKGFKTGTWAIGGPMTYIIPG